MQTHTAQQPMTRLYLVAAHSPNPAKPPEYFRRYHDTPQGTVIVWTRSTRKARQMAADEAAAEAKLLAPTRTTRNLKVEAA